MTKKDKITVDDIIGIVHTDEPTDSVEEVRKLRGRNERFIIDTAGTLIDMVTRDTYDYVSEVCPLLNGMAKENENLKDEVYEEMDNALTVLRDLYEDTPLKSQSKMNNLYNRLESLREEMK